MDTFIENIGSILSDNNSNEQFFLRTGYNVFIIGYQQSGKSTLANVLSDQQQLYFEKKGNQYTPINDNYFPITSEDEIGTKKPNSIEKQEYQIWDFPGYIYGLEEDSLENRILQIILMNQAPALQIIIDRWQNLIQLLNLISQKDLPSSIIISKVPPKVKLENVIGKLQTQLSQEEVIYQDEAKDLLNQIIQNNRIQIFNYPQIIEEVYQFKEDNIKQIQQLVFDKKYFHKVKIQYRFLSSQEIKIKEYVNQAQQKLKEINQSILSNTIKINMSRILRDISDQQLHKDEVEYQELLQQKHKYLSFNNIFQQISNINQSDDIIDSQINKINDFFISQDVKLMQNKLDICCANFSLNQLREIYEQNQNIKEIYIQSLHQFIIDCDIRMPGVHLYIKCKQFRVIIKSNIDLKGENGKHPPSKARSGDEINIHGDIGQNGYHGEPGGIFYAEADEYFCLEKLTIDISGGDGGNGQDGGDGYDGKDGEDGTKEDVKKRLKECEMVEEVYDEDNKLLVLHYLYKSKGTPGTIGGNSGGGGQGGQPGVKGIAQFLNFKQAEKKLNLIYNNNAIGMNGNDGKPGIGGKDGTDYLGIYKDVESFAPEIGREVIKDMNVLEIGMSVLLASFAIGYFGTLGIITTASLIKAKSKTGWLLEWKCDENLNKAPSGIIKQEIFQNQLLQKSCNQGETFYHQKLEIFIKRQKENIQQIRNQFQELKFPDEIIQHAIGEINL